MVKKTCRGTINLLKNQLEAAEQEISKLVSNDIRPVFLPMDGNIPSI